MKSNPFPRVFNGYGLIERLKYILDDVDNLHLQVFTNREKAKPTDHVEDLVRAELKVVQKALLEQQQGLKAVSEAVKEITGEVADIRESSRTLKSVCYD